MRTLLLALTIGFAAFPASAQNVKAGIEAWQKGDSAGAVKIWQPLAEKGDADAAFNLGQAYRLGKGVPLDLAQAQGWLEKAARKGHVDAAATLGLLLFQNGNRVSGMRWLKGAAEAGEARALLMVGTAMYNGDEVPRDPVTAYAYVSRAAAQDWRPPRQPWPIWTRSCRLSSARKGWRWLRRWSVARRPRQRRRRPPPNRFQRQRRQSPRRHLPSIAALSNHGGG